MKRKIFLGLFALSICYLSFLTWAAVSPTTIPFVFPIIKGDAGSFLKNIDGYGNTAWETNSPLFATKIMGTDASSNIVGAALSGLTWDGTTLSVSGSSGITTVITNASGTDFNAVVSSVTNLTISLPTAGTAARGAVPIAGNPFNVYTVPVGGGSYVWSEVQVVDEFLGSAVANSFNWTTQGSVGTTAAGTGEAGHFGVWTVNAGSGPATGSAGIRTPLTAGLAGSTTNYCKFRIKTPATLSNGTTTYQLYIGFTDNTVGEATDGAYFIYDTAISSNWAAKTASNSSRNTASGGTGSVTVSTSTWYDLVVALQSSTCAFYVSTDGGVTYTNIGTSTGATIPTAAGREFGMGLGINCSVAGDTVRTMTVDRCSLKQ